MWFFIFFSQFLSFRNCSIGFIQNLPYITNKKQLGLHSWNYQSLPISRKLISRVSIYHSNAFTILMSINLHKGFRIVEFFWVSFLLRVMSQMKRFILSHLVKREKTLTNNWERNERKSLWFSHIFVYPPKNIFQIVTMDSFIVGSD